MSSSEHKYIVIGDLEENQRKFKIEYNGLNVFIENINDQRFCLMLDKEDWNVMRKFIDEQFSKE